MSQTSDDAEPTAEPGPRHALGGSPGRPPWVGPVVILIGLVLVTLLCIGLSVWGP